MPGTGFGDPLSMGYPSNPFLKGLGALGGTPSNYAQSNLGPRSNFEPGFILPGSGASQDATAALITTDATVVAVPVQWGDEYNYVDILIGGTPSSTLTHLWVQLYSGVLTTAKPVGTQSTDTGSAAIGASTGTYTFSLGAAHGATPTAYLANQTDSPYGYLYVAIGCTASTVPSLISGTVASAAQGVSWYTDMPLFYAGHISASGATAPTSITLSSVTAQTACPIVVLR